MKQKLFILLNIVFSLAITANSDAQIAVTGKTNTTPNLAATYTTLAAAITDLNSISSISGPVTLTVTTSSYTETAPAGGYQITMSSITNTSSSPVVIDGDHKATITAYSPQASGSLIDAVFKIIGADYITIQKFTMQENASNTTTPFATNNMTEFGIALLRASTTNGAQYNSIIDNDIQLDRTYPNSFGIYSNVRHAAGSDTIPTDIANGTTGPNHGNKVYNNRISNVNMGLGFIGSNTDARMDDGNDIGGTSSSTGNSVTNWGGNSLPTVPFAGNMNAEYYGIMMRCEKNDNISWNTVTGSTSVSGSVAAPIRGIHNGTTTSTVAGTFTTTIEYNTVTVTDNLPNGLTSTSRVEGILSTDKLGSGTLSINYNTVTGLAITSSGSNRYMRCICNSASAANVYINSNVISGNTSTANASSSGSFIAIDQTGIVTNTIEINDNEIGDPSTSTPAITYSVAPYTAAMILGINHNPSTTSNGTSSIDIDDNTFYGFVTPNSTSCREIYITCDHTTSTNSQIHVDYNHFQDLDAHTTGDVYFIYSIGTMTASAGAHVFASNNDISGSFTKSLSGGDVYLYYAKGSSGTGNTMTEDGNNFSNISLTGSAVMHGWYNAEGPTAAGPEKSITNNIFDSWTCNTSGSSTSSVIYCDWASGNSVISGNTISNISSYGNLNCIFDASATPTTMIYDGNQISAIQSTNAALTALSVNGGGSAQRTTLNMGIDIGLPSGTSVVAITYNNSTGTGTNLNCYYNTVYMHINTTATTFSSACLAVRGNANSSMNKSYVRNNIFVNNSKPGTTSGKTAIIINQGTANQIGNYDVTSNNNDFWIGSLIFNASPISSLISNSTHVIYQDASGGTDRQTFANFQGYVPTGAETLSLSLMPLFYNANPDAGGIDLHLLPDCGNNPLFNHGNNQGIGATTDWMLDNDPRLTVSPYITDIGADEHILTNTWTGAAGTSAWNNNSNWSKSPFPNNSEINVYIPKATGTRPQPFIASGAAWQVDNVYFQTGLSSTSLPLLTNQGWLQVAGQITGDNGSFSNHNGTATLGSIELNGYCSAQTINGKIFTPGIVDGDVNNFKVSNTSLDPNPKVIVSPTNGELNVFGELSFGATGITLSSSPTITNDGITLKSGEFTPGVFTTANVAQINSTNTISGNVRVERYINTGNTGSQHNPSWELLATPTGSSSTGQSVYDSWQEGGSIPTGYGTWLAAPTGTSGYDVTRPTYSLKYWDPSVATFVGVPNTANNLYDQRGYFVFVHGDRNIQTFTTVGNPTNLRSKGPIYQPSNPPPTSTAINAGDFVQVGNPYASTIDLRYLRDHNFSGLNNDVTIWDPISPGTLGYGDYLTLSGANDYQPAYATGITPTSYYPSGRQCYDIQSGQAFYVTASTGGGSISFDESCKLSGSRLVTRTEPPSIPKKFFRAQLYSSTGVCDGNATVFANIYSNKIDEDDSRKMLNPGENFIIKRNDYKLVVEARREIKQADTIFYTFSNMRELTYQLKFAPKNFNGDNLDATLVDNYLKTRTALSLTDTSNIDFTVDKNNASFADRFYVVFGGKEEYHLAQTIAAVKNAKEGITGNGESSFSIYPNPVENRQINLRFVNVATGNYQMNLIDNSGRIVFSKSLTIDGKQTSKLIHLGNGIIPGDYRLFIIAQNGETLQQQVQVK